VKVAIVEKPGTLVVRTIPDPQIGGNPRIGGDAQIGDYEALCELLFAGVCTGTDAHIIDGSIPFKIPYPTILGHESIGRIVEVGAKVRSFRVGDLVTRVGAPATRELNANWGGFAELGVAKDHDAMREDGLPEQKWRSARVNKVLPPDFDPARSTMVITWRETWSYISRIRPAEGADVLVVGSGANGLSFANHARNRGARSVTLVGSPGRTDVAHAVGADRVYSYRDESHVDSIRAEVPNGFDLIIDAVGKRDGVATYLPLIADEGTMGVYGLDEPREIGVNPRSARKTFRFYNGGYDEPEAHDEVVQLIRDGKLRAEHYLALDRVVPLERIADAFEAVARREVVKPVIRLQGTE
jgi:threonine dehydrogenase-like Zn-dependent dehydrogenase